MAEIHSVLRDVANASAEAIAFVDAADELIATSPSFEAFVKDGFRLNEPETWAIYHVTQTAISGGVTQFRVRPKLSDAIFVDALEKLLDPVMIVDRDGILEWTNVEWKKSDVGLKYLDTLADSYRHVAEKYLEQTMEQEKVIVCPPSIVELGGSRYWFRGRMVPIIEDGALKHVAVFAQDITDHMEAVASLEISEARYRMLLSNASEMLLVFTPDMVLRYASENASTFLGYEPGEDLPVSPLAYVHTDDTGFIREQFDRAVEAPGRQVKFDARIRQKDHTYADFEIRMQLVSSDEPVILVAARDVTHQREAEQLRQGLIRADKLAAIGQLAAGVAHEINNPATFIYTNLYILKDYAQEFTRMLSEVQDFAKDLGPEELAFFETFFAENEIAHLLTEMTRMLDTNLVGMDRISMIVRDLRTFSRDDSDEVGPVNINDPIETATNMVRNHAKHVSELELDLQEVPLIFADQGKLTQVMMNLLMNAVHAVSDQPDPNKITVRSRTDGSSVMVEVEDTGSGIDESLHEIIFEPFFTTKPPEHGTGLGLWLCREIVRKNRGVLAFDTELGEGTTFRMTFPTSAPIIEHMPTSLGDEISSVLAARILMIDDDELVLGAYEHALGREHDLVLAHGGAAGIEELERDSHFDLVVCDLVMPDVDGPAFYDHVAEEHPDLLSRLLFCSAGAKTSRTRAFLDKHDVQIVGKPITPNQLQKFVRNTLQETN